MRPSSPRRSAKSNPTGKLRSAGKLLKNVLDLSRLRILPKQNFSKRKFKCISVFIQLPLDNKDTVSIEEIKPIPGTPYPGNFHAWGPLLGRARQPCVSPSRFAYPGTAIALLFFIQEMQMQGYCFSCGSAVLRRSRLRSKDILRLIFLQYPTRCWVCRDRDYQPIWRVFGWSRKLHLRRSE